VIIDPKIFFIFPIQIVIMLAYFPIARRLNLYDIPNERSSHKNIAFRGGGIIIPLSLVLYSLFFGFQDYWLISGVMIVSVVSFYDDYTGANVFVRLMCHFVALGLLMMEIQESLSNIYHIAPLITILIAIIGVATINAYNFMDGINAITGLYTLSVYETVFYYVYYFQNEPSKMFSIDLIAVLTAALLIFGFFNFRSKAVLFAGDVGSVSLGLISVFYVLKLISSNQDIIYLSMLAVYGVESGLTIFYRLYKRENIFQAHRKHLFQDLVNKVGLSHLTTSLLYTGLQVIINAGMFLALYNKVPGYYYFAFVIIMLVGIYIILKYQIHQRYSLIEDAHEKN
jgi:UDP-GlcNAc:undecaprenyl-phosphate GlcNAc-1-phosphate transferase